VREARFKAALCQVGLGRNEPAAELFRQVAAEQGGRWPPAAACHLCLLRLRQDRREEAQAVLVDLMARYLRDELMTLLPQALREEVLKQFGEAHSVHVLSPRPVSVQDLERLAQLQERFGADEYDRNETREMLIHACHEAGDLEKAIALAEGLLREPSIGPHFRLGVLEEYTWLLIRTNAAERARAELDRWLSPPGGYEDDRYNYKAVFRPLLLQRAKCLAVRKRWAEAEDDLRQFRAAADAGEFPAEADLLAGFIRHERGDPAGALAVWGDAYRRQVAAGPMLDYITPMLGSLSGQVKEEDVRKALDAAVTELDVPGLRALRNKLLRPSELHPVFQEMWRSRRGREYARQFAVGELSRADLNRIPAMLGVYEFFHQGALPGEVTAEQDELLWKLAGDMHAAYSDGSLTEVHLAQIALCWADATTGFTWIALSAQLKPALRGPLAYFLGHRCRRLKKSGAEGLFKQAKNDAPPNSLLYRLAEPAVQHSKEK
jgi:hypothetical protein